MSTSDEEELFGSPSSSSVVLILTAAAHGDYASGSQTPPSAHGDIRADYTPVNTLPAPKPSRNNPHHLSVLLTHSHFLCRYTDCY